MVPNDEGVHVEPPSTNKASMMMTEPIEGFSVVLPIVAEVTPMIDTLIEDIHEARHVSQC